MGKFEDLSGKKFGRLTAIEICGRDKYGKILYKCRCDCGNEFITLGRHLKNGHSKSCGCWNRDKNIEHSKYDGLAQEEPRLYNIWKGMNGRCKNPNNESFQDYGKRGITICEEWEKKPKGFFSFVSWAKSHGYKDNLSIDRINNNEGYSPDNCRWADWNTQANNRRKPAMIINQYGTWPYRETQLPEPPKEET